jgi:hypothetical protein
MTQVYYNFIVSFLLKLNIFTVNVIKHKERILKKGNSNTKSLAYTSLVRPILEYGAACWDPYRKGQINALDRLQNMAAKFAHHRNDSNWETLTQRRKVARICALFKAYMGERAWKAIGDRLQRSCYLSRKIRSRKQKTDN